MLTCRGPSESFTFLTGFSVLFLELEDSIASEVSKALYDKQNNY